MTNSSLYFSDRLVNNTKCIITDRVIPDISKSIFVKFLKGKTIQPAKNRNFILRYLF